MRINTSSECTYLNPTAKKASLKKKEDKKEFDPKISDKDHKDVKNKTKKKIIRYLLEGDIIKVYSYEGGKKTCIKIIPVANATPGDLAKVENLSFKEMLRIMQKQRNAKVV